MKAIAYHRHGPATDVLELEERPKPVPLDGEVLLRIRAAALNPLDRGYIEGKPVFLRWMGRKRSIPGADAAGEVEAVGKNVTAFEPGDAVFGICRTGTLAEYGCAPEGKLALKPSKISFEEAAAMPVAATTALQALRDRIHAKPGLKVLINGAAGGVGTYAVQIAKAFGADVTGVCSTANVELVRSLGADRVIDYKREDFIADGARYDAIFDLVGNRRFSDCRRVLAPDGILVPIGAAGLSEGGGWSGFLYEYLTSPFRTQKLSIFVAKIVADDLAALGELAEAGKVKSVIDRRYPLREAAEAARYQFAGHARGKVVVTI